MQWNAGITMPLRADEHMERALPLALSPRHQPGPVILPMLKP